MGLSDDKTLSRPSSRTPFAEPERTLAGTIGIIRKESFTRQKKARAEFPTPSANSTTSTKAQRLSRTCQSQRDKPNRTPLGGAEPCHPERRSWPRRTYATGRDVHRSFTRSG